MAGKEIRLGPAGEQVRANVKRLRGHMSYAELSRELERVGRPIPPLGLKRIEEGERRVDVDDLVALAEVFGQEHPGRLLEDLDMPRGEWLDVLGGRSIEDFKEEVTLDVTTKLMRTLPRRLIEEGWRGPDAPERDRGDG